MIRNKIITRGFSKTGNNLIVTRGFIPSLLERVIQQPIFKLFKAGKPSNLENKKQHCDEYKIKASLVNVNDKQINKSYTNTIKVVICSEPNNFVKIVGNIKLKFIETFTKILIKARITKWK